ncbi:MAG: RelA/SpoT family protein [Anaerolineae bacterium]
MQDVNALPSWDQLRNRLPKTYSPDDVELVRRAYELACAAHGEQRRKSGELYIVHPVAVASILAGLRLDAKTVAAALLHDVAEDTPIRVADLAEKFGAEVASLVDGVTKLESVSAMASLPSDSRDPKVESLRKMLLAMVSDVRVVLIKLADRLHNMRTLAAMPRDRQMAIARETQDIYAPLASVLGMYQLKWELEDLAFRYLEPEIYVKIATDLAEQREKREAYIARVIEILHKELEKHGISATIKGRPKHIYSIYRKMKRKGITFEQVYDQQGIRVIVPEVADCYAALGIIHTLWRPIKGEFDDYIANPKENQYQSLHTAVYGPEGKPLEVQIRTPEMDRIAEVGIAAHWRYKTQTRYDEAYERKIAWLRQVIDWQSQEQAGGSDFLATVKEDLFKDRVYVFTPKGEVIDLPAGSTPIDFAYRIHTEVGHRCRGARVRGKLVSLDYQLQSGDQVEIITVKRGGPSRDWLNPHLNYVKTNRARTKIRQWFAQQDRQENIAAGRALLERELHKLGAEQYTYLELANLFNLSNVDEFLEKIGTGDISVVDIAEKVLQLGKVEEAPKEASQALPALEAPQAAAVPADGVAVMGVGNMLTYLARCCHPMPPDEIIGFVTRGRGVAIHRQDCPNVRRLDRERLVQVSWGAKPPRTSRVKIRVQAFDRAGLLNEITGVLKEEYINLLDASAVTARQDNLALITATLEVRDAEQLSRVLTRIERLPNVREVRRQKG